MTGIAAVDASRNAEKKYSNPAIPANATQAAARVLRRRAIRMTTPPSRAIASSTAATARAPREAKNAPQPRPSITMNGTSTCTMPMTTAVEV